MGKSVALSRALLLSLLLVFLQALSTCGKSVKGVFLLEAGDFDFGPEYEITKFTFTTGIGRL